MMVDNVFVDRLPQFPLGMMGRWLKDDMGRVVIVRGVNMINKLPPYTPVSTGFGDADAKLLKDNGFNVVRVGMIYSALEPAPGVYDNHYLREIKKTVDTLFANGIMSLIDCHQDGWGPSFVCEGFPDWATLTETPIRPLDLTSFPALLADPPVIEAFDNLWQNASGPGNVGLQDRFAEAWKYAAGFLVKDTFGILGWELLNEPFPAKANSQALTSFTQKVVNKIREADKEHMIWYEPWVTFDEGVQTEMGWITDSAQRIGFAFHNYRNVDDDYAKVWRNASEHFQQQGFTEIPLLCTEFGAIPVASTIEAQMNSIDAAMMPVIYWAWWNRTPYVIDGPYQAPQMGLVYDPALPLGEGENVQWANLAALARPYPMLVAGMPSGWGVDSNGVFRFDYVRKSDSPRAYTQIFVPKSVYGTNPSAIKVDGGSCEQLNDQIALIWSTTVGGVTVTITPS